MATTTTSRLLSIPEVARRLDISRTSVYDLIKRGKLTPHNVGAGASPRARISEAELDAYIESTKRPMPRPGRRAA